MRNPAVLVLVCCFILGGTSSGVEVPGFDQSARRVEKIKGQFIVCFAENTNPGKVTGGFGMFRLGVPSVEKIFDNVGVISVRSLAPLEAGTSSLPGRTYVVRIPEDKDDAAFMERMAADPHIAVIEHDIACMIAVAPNDANYWRQWYLYQANRKDVHAQEAWEVETGSDTVVIAILDTGVNFRHPDLRNSIWVNPGEDIDGDHIVFDSTDFDGQDNDFNGYVDDVVGYDFFNGGSETPWPGEDGHTPDNDPNDFNGHGTHCAGIAAAVTNNGLGGAGLAGGWGPSWRGRGVQIMCLRVGYSAPHPVHGYETGFVIMSAVVEAINYAVNNGADVISYSAGSHSVSGLNSALVAVREAGIVFCHAAGNDGTENPTDQYFKDVAWLISVAYTTYSDTKAGSSNYGIWVEVAAPGTGIYSTYSYHYTPTYETLSGSSMATPLTAGLAALIKSHYPDYDRSIIDAMIINRADSINDSYYHDGLLGGGRINADSCLWGAPVAEFSGSPQVGPAPLAVNFIDESPAAASWSWTFGDGGSSPDQNPGYTYDDPGLYMVTLEVTDPNGTHTEVQKYYILATADTLYGDSVKAAPNVSFPVTVSLKNTVILDTLDLVFSFPTTGSPTLEFDSVSAEGTRGENFDTLAVKEVTDGAVAIQCIAWNNTGQDPLFPGDGPVLKLWFTASEAGSTVIDTTSTASRSVELKSRYHNYVPVVIPIELCLRLRGDANSDGSVNLADAVFLNAFVFREGPAPDPYEGDANDDDLVNLGDSVYLLNFIFHDGPAPPP